ncbi:MAG: hypothetical protein ACNA7J_08100 [Wenzhouxiangella sp.]
MKAEPRKDVNKVFIFHLLSNSKINQAVVSQSVRTAGQTGVNLDFLNNFDAYLPPFHLQNKFELIDKSIETQKSLHQQHLTELDNLFASLQSRAFNGTL